MSTTAAPFVWDFSVDRKAIENDSGDLYIAGYASDFDVDREEEAFERGAFDRGLQTYLATNPILLFHHKYDKALGQVVEAHVDSKGLFVKARLDRPASGSWAEDVFGKVKRGTIKTFSVGGIFKRRMTLNGPRIYDVDLGEISIMPYPVNARAIFSVVAGKAFADGDQLELGELRNRIVGLRREAEHLRLDQTSLLAASISAETRR
jgi:HK97 family phage prohead protease